ncbi:hypothetical protein C8Q75DRAFT_733130 [Abortiporus biennis]|nr:hypothetical protein C8Q75DRAFT_733130 [Abortiporus biennis]
MSSPSSCAPFAFAQIKGDVCLVQISNPSLSSSLVASDVRVFRHELITIFRFSHSTSIHPSDIHILELLDDHSATYEEEKDTVFLARDVMARMQKFSAASAMQTSRPYTIRRPPHAQTMRSSRMARIH